MQTKSDLEDWYIQADPWAYKNNAEDIKRKAYIIGICHMLAGTIEGDLSPFNTALDVCCGEGWITADLPAFMVYGYELADKAANRFPLLVTRLTDDDSEKMQLVTAMGCLYKHYDTEKITSVINKHAEKFILTCNIQEWEAPEAIDKIVGKQIFEATFPYREFTQKLRVFQK